MTNLHARSFGITALLSLAIGCGGTSGGAGTAGLATSGDAAVAASADLGSDAATQVPHADAGTTADAAPDQATTPPTVPTGAWQVKTLTDEMAAGFITVTIAADGTYTQTGRTDGIGQTGQYTQPTSITIDPSLGTAPAGMTGPYIALADNPLGDEEWVYGWSEAADRSSLSLTLYAKTNGMGLRWAAGQVIELVPVGSTAIPASPAGTWKAATTTDAQNAGFQTIEIDASGFAAMTGRTDGEPAYADWTVVTTPPVDPSFGTAPAGMVGPYISFDDSPYSGDGAWVYGWSEAADGSTLTLTLYAQRYGMGLRWAKSVVTIHLVKG